MKERVALARWSRVSVMDSFYAKLESLGDLAYARPPPSEEPAAGVASDAPQPADSLNPTRGQTAVKASDSIRDAGEASAAEIPSPPRVRCQGLVTAAAGFLIPRPALPGPMQGAAEHDAQPEKASPGPAPAQNLEDLLAQLDAFAFHAPPTPPRAEGPFKRRRGMAPG